MKLKPGGGQAIDVVLQSFSHVQLFATPRTAAHHTCFPILHHLPELAQTHIH